MTATSRCFAIFGAAPDTWNLGVSALLTSVVAAIDSVEESHEVVVFDNGFGTRSSEIVFGDRGKQVWLVGARHSKRLHRPDTLARIALAANISRTSNPAIARVDDADVVLDMSGGDSFSDIYGMARFSQVVLHKQIALSRRRPLVLLPQTFGPFRSRAARSVSARVVRRAAVASARDPQSFEYLQSLLGEDFDADRHRQGIDVAFGLPTRLDGGILDDELRWIESHRPVVGINVSGMLYLDDRATERFGLAADYRLTMSAVLKALLTRTDASILLVPHVVAPDGHPQSDIAASGQLAREFASYGERIRIASAPTDPGVAKGLISQTDWFAGSRMHATIAALSSGVPAAAIAYSPKAYGVFETAGMQDHVTDASIHTTEWIVDRLLWSFGARDSVRPALALTAQELSARARQQVVDVLDVRVEAPVRGRSTT